MMSVPLQDFVLPESATLREAMSLVDQSGHTIAVLIRPDGVLAGVLTDGDMRRGILRGETLDARAISLATLHPVTVAPTTGRAQALELMRAMHLSHLPIVDKAGRVLGLHTLVQIVGKVRRNNVAVIMAGGRGTRLGNVTERVPKPLVRVAGRPIIEWIILNLISGGIERFFVSVNYLSDAIVDYLGDGSAFGASIEYLRETRENPLGTAGSLSLLRGSDLGASPLIVTNADLMVQYDAGDLVAEHLSRANSVTVATWRYQHEIPYGVVRHGKNNVVDQFVEKPTICEDVSAGIYAVSHDALELVPERQSCSMPDLVSWCVERGLRVGSWALETDWLDIGTPQDLSRARGLE